MTEDPTGMLVGDAVAIHGSQYFATEQPARAAMPARQPVGDEGVEERVAKSRPDAA